MKKGIRARLGFWMSLSKYVMGRSLKIRDTAYILLGIILPSILSEERLDSFRNISDSVSVSVCMSVCLWQRDCRSSDKLLVSSDKQRAFDSLTELMPSQGLH